MARSEAAPSVAGRASLRKRLHAELDPAARTAPGLSATNRVLVGLILAAVGLAVAETEPVLAARFGDWFQAAEIALGVAFLAEYAARLWMAPEAGDPRAPLGSRIRFILSPAGLADLAAIVASLTPVVGASALILRLVRLLRILRIAKLGRMSRAMRNISAAVAARRDELTLSLAVGLFLMLVSATVLHLVEGPVQPDAFGSIPRALWWAVATLTTIGYGDVYPVTALGKFLAGLTAILSIGMVAMPAGILAAAFSDAVRRRDPDPPPPKA